VGKWWFQLEKPGQEPQARSARPLRRRSSCPREPRRREPACPVVLGAGSARKAFRAIRAGPPAGRARLSGDDPRCRVRRRCEEGRREKVRKTQREVEADVEPAPRVPPRRSASAGEHREWVVHGRRENGRKKKPAHRWEVMAVSVAQRRAPGPRPSNTMSQDRLLEAIRQKVPPGADRRTGRRARGGDCAQKPDPRRRRRSTDLGTVDFKVGWRGVSRPCSAQASQHHAGARPGTACRPTRPDVRRKRRAHQVHGDWLPARRRLPGCGVTVPGTLLGFRPGSSFMADAGRRGHGPVQVY